MMVTLCYMLTDQAKSGVFYGCLLMLLPKKRLIVTQTNSVRDKFDFQSDGWNDEKLYCCGADLCNENTNSASSNSLQVFTAGSALLMLAFHYSH
uniref:Protein quiver n=1 Tax=Ascaris lumbricoides TaxID=6252 RepID=A0A0M3HV18_ASCLU